MVSGKQSVYQGRTPLTLGSLRRGILNPSASTMARRHVPRSPNVAIGRASATTRGSSMPSRLLGSYGYCHNTHAHSAPADVAKVSRPQSVRVARAVTSSSRISPSALQVVSRRAQRFSECPRTTRAFSSSSASWLSFAWSSWPEQPFDRRPDQHVTDWLRRRPDLGGHLAQLLPRCDSLGVVTAHRVELLQGFDQF